MLGLVVSPWRLFFSLGRTAHGVGFIFFSSRMQCVPQVNLCLILLPIFRFPNFISLFFLSLLGFSALWVMELCFHPHKPRFSGHHSLMRTAGQSLLSNHGHPRCYKLFSDSMTGTIKPPYNILVRMATASCHGADSSTIYTPRKSIQTRSVMADMITDYRWFSTASKPCFEPQASSVHLQPQSCVELQSVFYNPPKLFELTSDWLQFAL